MTMIIMTMMTDSAGGGAGDDDNDDCKGVDDIDDSYSKLLYLMALHNII